MKLDTQRVGTRVEAAMEGSQFQGRPGLWITAYDDPDEAIADAERFLSNAREAKAEMGE